MRCICPGQLRSWADILLIAPLSANTLAKLSSGQCDGLLVRACCSFCVHCKVSGVVNPRWPRDALQLHVCVRVHVKTCVARAWDLKPRSNKQIIVAPAMNTAMWEHPFTAPQLATLVTMLHASVVPPVAKKLACGDIGGLSRCLWLLSAVVEHLWRCSIGGLLLCDDVGTLWCVSARFRSHVLPGWLPCRHRRPRSCG